MGSAEIQTLDNMFSGIEDFQKEFPAIYEDIEQSKQQDNVMLKASNSFQMNDSGWEDFEKIRMIYNPKEEKLKIKGRIHKTRIVNYSMAEMRIYNKNGEIRTFRYTIENSTFLLIDEELQMWPSDLDGIYVEMKYMLKLCGIHMPEFNKIETSQIEEEGRDIVKQGKILHPVSKRGHDKIDIIYWRDDRGNTADYHYNSDYPLKFDNSWFGILLPVAVQFQLDQEFELADDPKIEGNIYVCSKHHGISRFNNWAGVRMLPVSEWKDNGNVYPEIKKDSDLKYIFALPQEWKSRIEKDGIDGNDDFRLSLDVQFTCKDGKRYSLEINSQINPRPYSGGSKIEIPCFHILWGCIEKNAQIEVQGRGRITVSEVQIGEKVLTKDHTYETVCDILTGDEEILKYVKVNGQEIMVTMDHPIMTKVGWMPARELCEGTPVLCEDGNFYPIQEIYDEPYYDKVYSLNLENGEGFFANQIYVGDFKMQNNFKEEETEIPQEILDELEKFKDLS